MEQEKQEKLNQQLITASHDGKLKRVKKLISQGANIHEQDSSPLLFAAIQGHFEVVKYLVEQGVDITVKDNYGLKLVSSIGNLEILQFLILNCNCNIQILLEEAQINGHNHVVEWYENYIQSKKLNDTLEEDLKKENNTTNKKMKI